MMAKPNGVVSYSQMSEITALDIFRARAEARALLFAAGELDLHLAVDELQHAAAKARLISAIGQDGVQAIMSGAFGAVR